MIIKNEYKTSQSLWRKVVQILFFVFLGLYLDFQKDNTLFNTISAYYLLFYFFGLMCLVYIFFVYTLAIRDDLLILRYPIVLFWKNKKIPINNIYEVRLIWGRYISSLYIVEKLNGDIKESKFYIIGFSDKQLETFLNHLRAHPLNNAENIYFLSLDGYH